MHPLSCFDDEAGFVINRRLHRKGTIKLHSFVVVIVEIVFWLLSPSLQQSERLQFFEKHLGGVLCSQEFAGEIMGSVQISFESFWTSSIKYAMIRHCMQQYCRSPTEGHFRLGV